MQAVEAKCEKKFEVVLMFETCSSAKHLGAAIEKAFEVAKEHGLVATDFTHFPNGDGEISDEPFVWLEFLASSQAAGDKATKEFEQQEPQVFAASCSCLCPVCSEGRRIKHIEEHMGHSCAKGSVLVQ
jgi:hypothetical protein